MTRPFKDLSGQRFGKLIAKDSFLKGKFRYWNCDCDCGNTNQVQTYHLINGAVLSCGCFLKQWASVRESEHGLSKHPLYKIWNGSRDRCNNPNCKDYHRYGGRGISYEPIWNDFSEFYKWALSNGYEKGLTLDRIDSNGNYGPYNCRWATMKEQQNNRRNNIKVVYKGKEGILRDFLGNDTKRIAKVRLRLWYGWDVERAIDTP